ncbi:MFS transporter [Actinopolymorpha sp. B11F2]|uniref:MFS transporter n=1 Tax=Actinopolymorpha sp. B11F2 TaxID=3160862 RepID=UPI0032E3AFE8
MPTTRRGLGLLLASTGVAITGQGMVTAAAPLLAASLTRDPFAVSAVTAASYAAWLIVGLPAGALVDRWPRRAVLVSTDLARAVVLGVLALLIATGYASVPALIVAVFLVGVGSCFFDPAAQAAIPAVVGRDKTALTHANGKMWALDTFGRSLAGPPLGAATFGVAAALPFGLDAGAFLASAVLLLGLPRLNSSPPTNGCHQAILPAIRAGLVFLFTHAELRLLAFGMAAYNLAYNIAFATLVLFVQDRLHLGDLGFGLLLAVMAVGGIAGGWVAPRIATHVPARVVYAGALAAQGLAWAAVLLSANVWVSCAALALVGLASTTVSVVGGAARQLLTPDEMLGRMVSATRLLGIGAAALGALIGGAVASLWGIAAPFVGAAALLTVFCALFIASVATRPSSAE